MTPLKDAIEALPYDFPDDIKALLAEGNAQILNSGLAEHALKAGDSFPAFTLPNASGNHVSSADLLAQGPLIISFYRGSWCPICQVELKAFQDRLDDIHALGAQFVAVTPERPDSSLSDEEKANLPFPVLTDENQTLAEALKIVFELPDLIRPIYEAGGVSLPEHNSGGTWRLPFPATFVVAQDGRIALAFVEADYAQRLEPEDAIAALKSL